MIESTNAIVINSIKFGETSLIATCFTKKNGIKSYLLKGVLSAKKSKIKPAYFQPLTQLSIKANHNTKGNLNYLKDAEIFYFYNSIHTDIRKQTITVFLSEILYFSIKEEEQNTHLYEYLETSLIWLDSHNSISNFHLLFLLNLTRFLGFYPKINLKNDYYFDLLEGQSCKNENKNTISGDKLEQFKRLLGINFDRLDKIDFSSKNRQDILSVLIQYFELHLSEFNKLKSLSVLKSVFS